MKAPFYVPAYVAAVVVFFLLTFFIPENGGIDADKTLGDSAKATLDYLTELAKLIGTLNTALFGACGALAIKGKDWSARWEHVDGYLIVVSLVAGAISYYGAYLMHTAILEMVYHGTVDPFSVRLAWALNLQYYGTLFGVFVVGLVFVRMMGGRKE